jgi:hypothetical protein
MNQPSRRCAADPRAGLLALCLSAASVLAGCSSAVQEAQPAAIDRSAPERSATGSASAEVQALHARCTDAMVRSACVASQDSSPPPSQSPATVLVAGVGAIDARFYAQLRSAGDAMCGQIVQPCEARWDGAECRTARALWPELPASAAAPAAPVAIVAARPAD